MIPEILFPSVDLLRQEYVLVQAWKKTASYIRYHNWYSDTLKLDWTTINLPAFISDISECLEAPEQWQSDSLRLVPAPKRQRWKVSKEFVWKPEPKKINGTIRASIRPLAHVSIKDQVVATALMLCLANRIETRQGDPNPKQRAVNDAEYRKKINSYGNRLFCDVGNNQKLYHRWGSSKLYRSYFQDYQSFISRPTKVAESIDVKAGKRVFIIESDLSQFYDRVRPNHLMRAIRTTKRRNDDPTFFDLVARVLNWQWHPRDASDVAAYARSTSLEGFSRVALPQGLVSAGFFANLVLLAFDESIRNNFGNEITENILLEDASRYVDDLRIVVTTHASLDETQVQTDVLEWLQGELDICSPGLLLSKEKTKAVEIGETKRSLVRQSTRMKRIQSAVSGGFDAISGQEILDAIQGLMRSQRAFSRESGEHEWQFSPVPDVPDETVARFSAARFRTTYRSLRPLLEDSLPSDDEEGVQVDMEHVDRTTSTRSRQALDEDARSFSLGLIERWIKDPSNVRLLRIGLDIWPDPDVLYAILGLLRPFTEKGGLRNAPRRVAWYCLAELLRAGATETGFVKEGECLPNRIDIRKYRTLLRDEAVRLIGLPTRSILWYLRQQALLFLAVFSPTSAPVTRAGSNAETRDYRKLILFLRAEDSYFSSSDFATLAVLSRRSFSTASQSTELAQQGLTKPRKREIAIRDPSFALELSETDMHFFDGLPARIRNDLCIEGDIAQRNGKSLVDIVLAGGSTNPLRNELSLLRFATAFLKKLRQSRSPEMAVIAPHQVRITLTIDAEIGEIAGIENLEINSSRVTPDGSLYHPPTWCDPKLWWRFQLGFLMRFILSGQPDFTAVVRRNVKNEESGGYRSASSHWYQRRYGFYNAQAAFGDDWLPITDWVEKLLLALLLWPGVRHTQEFKWTQDGITRTLQEIENRIVYIESNQERQNRLLLLPMIADWPTESTKTRPLRACVVQTVFPLKKHLTDNWTLTKPSIRKEHRNHLRTAIEAVKRMLDLRRTHKGTDGRLDWLILPELAVHPLDLPYLSEFARSYRTLILTGLTYEELFRGEEWVNSALWIIPEWSKDHGLQIRMRRQGKFHLAHYEKNHHLQGFRPCQWLIGYPWCDRDKPPVWLTASVCYDATDLDLVATLRKKSDVFAVPAFNPDIKTFDQMALALHYHMFQLVVVANNGQYGGSNAYWPRHNVRKRQIFHLHGQPQASMAFFEIDDIEDFLERGIPTNQQVPKHSPDDWKHPPAGWDQT